MDGLAQRQIQSLQQINQELRSQIEDLKAGKDSLHVVDNELMSLLPKDIWKEDYMTLEDNVVVSL